MADIFNWGYDRHDFSAIQETISKYFPVENPDQYNEENIGDFEGVRETGEILNENFVNTKNYKERWVKFRKFLKQELKRSVHESMIAFYPCYSGIITLKKEKNQNLTYTKELHFFISLLGPYFTIFGIDKSQVILEELFQNLNGGEELHRLSYQANLAITVSPYLEYKEDFLTLQNKILEYFPSFKFIPNEIYMEKITEISIVYPDSEAEIEDTVFSALFRPENFFKCETRGDTFFGADDWLVDKKLDKNRIDEIKKGFLEKSLKAGSKISLNKVWKFKSAHRLINSDLGNSFFGMDPIQILDLTDSNVATIISKEDEEPRTSKYSVSESEITIDNFGNKMGFRIKELTYDELQLILHVNFVVDDKKAIKGDILEMIFGKYH